MRIDVSQRLAKYGGISAILKSNCFNGCHDFKVAQI